MNNFLSDCKLHEITHSMNILAKELKDDTWAMLCLKGGRSTYGLPSPSLYLFSLSSQSDVLRILQCWWAWTESIESVQILYCYPLISVERDSQTPLSSPIFFFSTIQAQGRPPLDHVNRWESLSLQEYHDNAKAIGMIQNQELNWAKLPHPLPILGPSK